MKRFLMILVCLGITSTRAADFDAWTPTTVPGTWSLSGPQFGEDYNGFAWYRCYVRVPSAWAGSRLLLVAHEIGDVDEAFFNGEKIGANGSLPPLFSRPSSQVRRPFVIEPDQVRFGDYNLVAWRVFDQSGEGGLLSGPIHLSRKNDAIDLAGNWLVREGDKPAWKNWLSSDREDEVASFQMAVGSPVAGSRGVVPADQAGREAMVNAVLKRFEGNPNVHSNVAGKGDAKSPDEAREALQLSDGLAVDTVLHEPLVRQPLFVDFDDRGRLWVVQYIQYPDPAGLELLTWDNHLRKVFDRVPPPPPYRTPEEKKFEGRDRITFHEDTDDDGVYDRHGVFVEGLNLATSIAFGRGGVWVLNPPYLLFYPDADQDDQPDGDPVVHLSGFGLEDTHSIANSLKWGPDGWLYGAVGSTVTARIRVNLSGSDERHAFFGQNIWRYHPETHRFELFAEGGWNTFGVDFDDQGRLYSGTNGNLQAVYFVQGGYYQKTFGKHGPHTNPYTFGHFFGLPIEGEKVRLVHQWVLYQSGAIPSLENHFVGGNSLANKLHALRIETDGSRFRTVEVENPITTDDKWFRPVHATVGPDGALYVSDWYDARITHVDPRDNWDRDRGRIYRLRASAARPGSGRDLRKLGPQGWVESLRDRNQWVRRTAQRLLMDRQDLAVVPMLQAGLNGDDPQVALESLWALQGLGRFDDTVALQGLTHSDPHVRRWSMRLLGDSRETLSPAVFDQVILSGSEERDSEVLSQIAATAQRLPVGQGLPLVTVLAARDELVADPYIPQQIWWAMESQLRQDPAAVRAVFDESDVWNQAVFSATLTERIGRRFMAEQTAQNLEYCAELLTAAPTIEAAKQLVRGMEKALEGSRIDDLPLALEEAVRRLWENFPLDADLVAFALRLGSEEGRLAARRFIVDAQQPRAERVKLVQSLSQLKDSDALPLVLELFRDTTVPSRLRLAAVSALRRYTEEVVADVLIRELPSLQGELADTAQSVLAGRASWSLSLLEAVDRGELPRETVRYNSLLVMQGREDPVVRGLVRKHWGVLRQPEEEKLARMATIRKALATGSGNADQGRTLFEARCALCHRLFDVGKAIGPELTGYERDNLEFLLPAIVDPSLALREEYELVSISLRRSAGEAEGTIINGFIADVNDASLTVMDLIGNKSVIAKRDIAGQERSRLSAMPEGLLDDLTEQQVRDLFAFLQR